MYTKIPIILIFSLWEEIVFRNFEIFPFLEKAIFSLFSSRKDAHFFVFVTQKRYGNVTFSDYGNVRKSPKISSFCIFSRIFTPYEKMWFCAAFPLLYMFLLTTKFVRNSHFQGRIFFIFLKTFLRETRNSFNTKFQPQWKDRKSN